LIKKRIFYSKNRNYAKTVGWRRFRHFRKCRHFENILFEQCMLVGYQFSYYVIQFWKIQGTGYVNQPVYFKMFVALLWFIRQNNLLSILPLVADVSLSVHQLHSRCSSRTAKHAPQHKPPPIRPNLRPLEHIWIASSCVISLCCVV
jgi:hypothetical protein